MINRVFRKANSPLLSTILINESLKCRFGLMLSKEIDENE
jgi:hypothetical protein